MGSYKGPKVRLSRRLQAAVGETAKHVSPRRAKPPGPHRRRRGRQSLYGLQLKEKQKIAAYYNIRDTQLRRYVRQAQVLKQPTVGTLVRQLESRLDNVVRRLRWVRGIWQARQMVSHGHILVNGRKIDLPSFSVKPGDHLSIKAGSEDFVKSCAESTEDMGFRVPDWLVSDGEKLQATVVRLPEREEVLMPFEVDYAKIIEYYSR